MTDYDVIVIGGGHAGVEAATAAARIGCKTLLLTLDLTKLGALSCNPAIGGVGKGHIVREVDAFDGVIGQAADDAGLQFRLLNRSKGPAVRGPRAQVDRDLYRMAVQKLVAEQPGLICAEGMVDDLIVRGGRCHGVVTAAGDRFVGRTVVLTTGTFLRGVIHRGAERIEAGRVGERSAVRLGERLTDMALPLGRLKTGTPPRLDGRTIDWDAVQRQPGDEVPTALSFLTQRIERDQLSCGITHTNPHTHEIIERNLDRSAVYGGGISGQGPRYCPSIEDKVVRFADRSEHQVFLEPEGYDDDTVYPNGISTSLPTDVQEAFVRSIHGLSAVEIAEPGYAIEYDYVDPKALRRTLELWELPGLYLAGQINGTTGYEEAAGQGLVAGVNAARAVRDAEPWIVQRDQAYLGVMVDDLITHGVTEPYRMFTSRAEYRLSLRADNADQRLTPVGIDLGAVGQRRTEAFHVKQEALAKARTHLTGMMVTPSEAGQKGIRVNEDGRRRPILSLVPMPTVGLNRVLAAWPPLDEVTPDLYPTLEADALYDGYLDRQAIEIEQRRRHEACPIPADFSYDAIVGLSNELRDKLTARRPDTLAAAGQIEGMTPSALSLLLLALRRAERAAA